MQKINTLNSSHLRNSEHVEFYHNVLVAIQKQGTEALGLTATQLADYKLAVDTEQDIVNRSTGSEFTPEMEAMDKERDRIFKLIRHKLQACMYESPDSDVAQFVNLIDKYLLKKYGGEIVTAAYQEESAQIRGFILDVRERLAPNSLELIGIASDLDDLESFNDRFVDEYHSRVTEKSTSTSELTKKLRDSTESYYSLLTLHFEYKANADDTTVGKACSDLIAVINVLVRDAAQRLETRLGKSSKPVAAPETELVEG